jgi:hypothetical protein
LKVGWEKCRRRIKHIKGNEDKETVLSRSVQILASETPGYKKQPASSKWLGTLYHNMKTSLKADP